MSLEVDQLPPPDAFRCRTTWFRREGDLVAGETTWSASVHSGDLLINWDWTEIQPQVVVMTNPLGARTNFKIRPGREATPQQLVLLLYQLGWEDEVLRELGELSVLNS